jgi:uncharacterized membrane protein YagU involved in acid resistance
MLNKKAISHMLISGELRDHTNLTELNIFKEYVIYIIHLIFTILFAVSFGMFVCTCANIICRQVLQYLYRLVALAF